MSGEEVSAQRALGTLGPIPEGIYIATIVELIKQKNNYVKATFEITGPTYKGAIIFGKASLKSFSRASSRMFQWLMAAGIDPVELEQPVIDLEIALLNKELRIRVKNETHWKDNEEIITSVLDSVGKL
jgi:hypothetical protein